VPAVCLSGGTNTNPNSDLNGVQTLRTQDTSDPRHFGPSKRPGIGAEVSFGHFGTILVVLDSSVVTA